MRVDHFFCNVCTTLLLKRVRANLGGKNMNKNNRCPECGGELPRGALAGLCPACLLKQGALDSAPQATPFTPPTPAGLAPLFPQFEIRELIGRGGMGAVYLARQKELDRDVALKILPPDIGRDVAFAERFTREARAMAKLNHPNIVTIYDFGRANGLFYFVMEFVDGVNLRQLLHTGRVAPRAALAIVPQICDALQYAHDAGIVHRDIKPENILLDRQGRVKVADFGLAKLVGTTDAKPPITDSASLGNLQSEISNVVMGTPQYMAPEQREHPSEVDHRADIYSLGVVFYQMLTGELPKGDFAPPSKKVVVDVRLDEVVLRALEQKPERRYQQVSEVKTLVETIATTPAAAVPQPPSSADARFWVPLQPPLMRELCSHMTKAERRESFMRSMLFGLWNAGTWFAPLFACMFLPSPLGWIFGFCALMIGLSFYPFIQRLMTDFLCSTQWARQQGITIQQLYALQRAQQRQGATLGLWLASILGNLGIVFGVGVAFYFMQGSHSAPSLSQLSWTKIGELPVLAAIPITILGTTFLGWINVRQIRQSAGMLPGLKLAVFDGLFFPLLALDGVFVWVVRGLVRIFVELNSNFSNLNNPQVHPALKTRLAYLLSQHPELTIFVVVVLLIIVDFLIIRAVWRAVNKNAAPQVPSAGKTGALDSPLDSARGGPSLEKANSNGRIAYVIFTLLYLALAIGVMVSTSWLPERVATHFGIAGRPNGWMTRTGYLVFTAAFPLLLAAFFAGITALIKVLPARFVNIPNRAFWLAPERRATTTVRIRHWLAGLLCLMTLFFAGLHVLTIVANRSAPPQLPMGGLLLLVIVFLLALMIWLSMFLMRFAEIHTAEKSSPVASIEGQRKP